MCLSKQEHVWVEQLCQMLHLPLECNSLDPEGKIYFYFFTITSVQITEVVTDCLYFGKAIFLSLCLQ